MPITPATLKDQWTAYAQSLRLWALQFVVWLATWTGYRSLRLHAQSEIRYLRREVRDILIARATLEILEDLPKQGKAGPAHARPAQRSLRCFRRFVLRGIRLRTFHDAQHALDHLDAYVACCLANYREGMKRRRKLTRVQGSVRMRSVRACVAAPDT